GDDRAPFRLVPQGKSEDAVEPVEEAGRLVLEVQRVDRLAVRSGLEGVVRSQFGLELAVVVDLAVDRQHQPAVAREQRLRAAGGVDDGQPLVDEDRALVEVHAAPVGTAMALALRQVQRLAAQRRQVVAGLQPEDAEDRTHGTRTPGKNRPGRTQTKRPAPCDAGLHGRRGMGNYAWLQPAARTRLFAARLRLRTFALLTDCVAMARRYSGAARPCNSCRHNRHRGAGILAPGAGCAPATPVRETILSETTLRLSRTSQVIAMLARYRSAGILTGLDLGDVHEEDPAQAGDDELAERFVSDLEAMGPAFVKLGQALSTRPDLVPAAWIAALERTQDNATPAPIGDIEVLLEKELGVRASKLFAQS